MQQHYVQVLPKSAIGKALAYSPERWDKLFTYVTDGRLNIDNNPVGDIIRPVALGRKNYLFAGSHEAAKRSGMLYSLLDTYKMHGVEPYSWLKDVLQQIADHPINRIQDLPLTDLKKSAPRTLQILPRSIKTYLVGGI
ncbi:MAG TPA: transposase [Niastella sp.]